MRAFKVRRLRRSLSDDGLGANSATIASFRRQWVSVELSMDAKKLGDRLRGQAGDLDRMVQTIRLELEHSRRETSQAVPGEDPLSIQASPSHLKKKTLAERLDIRVLFQRLIGVRRAVKLAKRLDALQHGRIPLQELPQIVDASRARLATITDNVEGQARDLAELRRLIEAIDKRVAVIAEKTALIPEGVNAEDSDTLHFGSRNIKRDAFADYDIDALYAKLDERFRSSREDTLVYQNVYLPAIKAAIDATHSKKIIHIGCRHGAFIELLRTIDIEGISVDVNSIILTKYQDLYVNINNACSYDYISKIRPNSLAAVCALRVIDHLPFNKIVDLIDCARRALAPCGILLIENQNPANLFVAEEKLYLDPMRRNPLSSELMSFIVESCGFVDLTVVQSHFVSEARREYDDPMLALLQDKIYGAQAYGIIARKPF